MNICSPSSSRAGRQCFMHRVLEFDPKQICKPLICGILQKQGINDDIKWHCAQMRHDLFAQNEIKLALEHRVSCEYNFIFK